MREIEFRGRSKRTKKWVYGNLIVKKRKTGLATLENGTFHNSILYRYKYSIQYFTENGSSRTVEVMPETIGQYIATNEYGNRIYEGMKLYDEVEDEYCTVEYDELDHDFVLEYSSDFCTKAYCFDELQIIEEE